MLKTNNIKLLEDEFNIKINEIAIEKLKLWEKYFLEYNSTTNLMSKNDTEVLFEKHVVDSLMILKWDKFLSFEKILDVGTGGGFPSVILSVFFPEKIIIANDSRIKKINFIKEIKEKLELDNLKISYSRIEDEEPLNVDLIVSRAVGKIFDVWELSKKHLKKDGFFAIYKSKTYKEEIEKFKLKYKKADFKIIPYNLPLEEEFVRNLIILQGF